jgi:hypothetical protein
MFLAFKSSKVKKLSKHIFSFLINFFLSLYSFLEAIIVVHCLFDLLTFLC